MKRSPHNRNALTILLAGAAMLALTEASFAGPNAAQARKPLPILQRWAGKVTNKALRAKAPACGFVADGKTWQQLCEAWRPKAKVPKVDFTKDIVLVATASGPNLVRIFATVDDAGHVKVLAASTRMAGPGFAYGMARVSRKGIKTVNGKPIHAAAGPEKRGKLGGYQPVPVNNPRVIAAANFAIHAEQKQLRAAHPSRSITLKLIKIRSAQQQVVSGINFRLDLQVSENGRDKQAQAVVWWQACNKPHPYRLTSWTWEKSA